MTGLEDLWSTVNKEGIVGSLIAAFFGLLRYSQDFTQDPPPKFRLVIAALKATTAGAAGWLATLLLLEWSWIPDKIYLSGILLALSGWGGAEFINTVKEGFYDFLRKRFSETGGAATNGTTRGGQDQGPAD
jgi:hypothetical protein